MPKRILIVAYAFPPSNRVAVHRVLRLSKWLPHYGWEPIILTVQSKYSHPYFYGTLDPDLCDLIPDDLEVHRAQSFDYPWTPIWAEAQIRLMKAIAVPDAYVTWLPSAISIGKKLIEERQIDIVLTTISPNSTTFIGRSLKKLTSARWIIDYRDPWCLNPFKRSGRLRLFLEQRIEDSMLARSDFNITTSDLMTNTYQAAYPQIANRFRTITNCFDPALQFLPERSGTATSTKRVFRIVHAGTVYPKRTPTSFMSALANIARRNPDILNDIEVVFVGRLRDNHHQEIMTFSEKHSIRCQLTGQVSYKESMRYIFSADLLLAINGIEERDNVFIPAKIFDYIAANKPILLIGHEGPASEIIRRGQLGSICNHDDPDEIGVAIKEFYSQWRDSKLFEPNFNFVNRFHASNVAEKLAEVLEFVRESR